MCFSRDLVVLMKMACRLDGLKRAHPNSTIPIGVDAKTGIWETVLNIPTIERMAML